MTAQESTHRKTAKSLVALMQRVSYISDILKKVVDLVPRPFSALTPIPLTD